MYILTINESDYDSNRVESHGYSESKELLEKKITRFNFLREKCRELCDYAYGEEIEILLKPIIDDQPQSDKHLDIPKWGQGIGEKDITKEMRDERNSIIEKNKFNYAIYSNKYDLYKKKLNAERLKLTIENNSHLIEEFPFFGKSLKLTIENKYDEIPYFIEGFHHGEYYNEDIFLEIEKINEIL